MKLKPSVIVASAVFAGALTAGGVSLASAQESTTTVPEATTPERSTPAPDPGTDAHDGRNCPEKDATTGSTSSGTSSSS
jgi:hypothetical protein